MIGKDTELRQAMQQTLDGKLGGPALLRRFMAHDDWLVPVEVDAEGRQRAVLIKDTAEQRFQLVFSDEQAYQDGGKVLGTAVLGERSIQMNGRDLFADLSDDPDVISINWGSPPELFFKKAQFPSLRRWARAVRVEQTLASPRPDLSLLKHFDAYYIVLQKVEGGYALTLTPDKHDRKIAAVFTAEDTLEAFLNDQRAGQINFEPVTRSIPGEHLFDDIKDLPLDGIAFNYSGPAPRRMFIAKLAADVMAAE
ncbi:MAG: hypothetical protein M1434_05215 [Chloroflexi bacterium]|nr:hypothetical protein [Chloroflexota bacterium]